VFFFLFFSLPKMAAGERGMHLPRFQHMHLLSDSRAGSAWGSRRMISVTETNEQTITDFWISQNTDLRMNFTDPDVSRQKLKDEGWQWLVSIALVTTQKTMFLDYGLLCSSLAVKLLWSFAFLACTNSLFVNSDMRITLEHRKALQHCQ
jgi:hypothetical protein